MGAPSLPPVSTRWIRHCEYKLLPAEPGMEADCAIWIEELQAWVAEDAADAAELRSELGPDARILTPSQLPR